MASILKVNSRSKGAAGVLSITSTFQPAGMAELSFQEAHIVLPLTSHWPEFSHMTVLSCKGGWEI